MLITQTFLGAGLVCQLSFATFTVPVPSTTYARIEFTNPLVSKAGIVYNQLTGAALYDSVTGAPLLV